METNCMDMPPELARRLFKEGAFLIILGIPVGTEFGIDFNAYKIGELFRGIKMIPPGPHFVYTAAENTYGENALRVGFMHYFQRKELVLREWDDQNEELRPYTKDDIDAQIAKIRANLQELDKFLAPYDYQNLNKWKTLTSEITEEILLNVRPENGIIRTSAEFQSCSDADRPKGKSPLNQTLAIRSNQTEDELLPSLNVIPGTAPRFTKIPALCSKNAAPDEISQCHLDSIRAIEIFFASFQSPIDAIREIQLSFVFFLLGYSVDGLAHWRKMLGLLANSEKAILKFKDFYCRYLDVLQNQLPDLPEELMMPTPTNTVFKDVKCLVVNATVAGLKQKADALCVHLINEMSWSFDDAFEEDPEDLPVIVEL